jgi:hypothetical protein
MTRHWSLSRDDAAASNHEIEAVAGCSLLKKKNRDFEN